MGVNYSIMNCCAQPKKHDSDKEIDEKRPDNSPEIPNEENIRKKVNQDQKTKIFLLISFMAGIIIGFVLSGIYGSSLFKKTPGLSSAADSLSSNSADSGEQNLPSFSESVVLPVRWDNLGKQMVESGVINASELEKIYSQRGGLDEDSKKLLYSADNGNLVINAKNSSLLLNLLWALGLGNKNPVLENGPMQEKQYGGPGNFASTGGWTLAKGETMDHYSKYNFVNLTAEQQALVEQVSKEIYRPCCGNSTYFPDCNHGMAMLGLLELMASQGASEAEMYKTALIVNSYWFPDNYKTIAKFMQSKGVKWGNVNPQEILGANLSSIQGYNQIVSQIQPVQGGKGGGCGV